MNGSFAAGCALCVVAPVMILATCAFAFENGAPKRSESSWLDALAPLVVVAVAATLSTFLVEAMIYDADVTWALRWAFAMNLAVVAAWADFKERIVPNKLVIGSMVAGVAVVAVQVFCDVDGWIHLILDAVLGTVVGGAIFLLTRFISRGGVGFGDVKLFSALGLLVGLNGLINVVFYTAFAAFIVAIALLIARKKKLADRLPLGPFALFGVFIAVSFGV